MSLEESYLNSLDDQPKDLTVKTAKKMKHIPPPLNLTQEEMEKMPLSTLKEFAIIATSPKSPLMQKHLPFRKRAHSIPVNLPNVASEAGVTISPAVFEAGMTIPPALFEVGVTIPPAVSEAGMTIPPTVEENFVTNAVLSSSYNYTSGSLSPTPNVVHKSADCREMPSTGQPLPLLGHRSHTDPISTSDLLTSTHSFALDLSTNPTSALLSPAPSSLGSSREELADTSKHINKFVSWGYHWPPPVWHCFQPGSRVKVGGCWWPVEEMTSYPPDWPGELLIERITLTPTPQITCCALSSCGEIVADITPCHPLLVKDRGWVAVCPDTFHKRYGLKCLPLQPGDIILHPSLPHILPLPSPDICDRIKRFSFPTLEESPPSPAFLLSPPTTPTRKNQDVTDKPKRPMNAFMLFAKRYRLELIQTNPGKDNRAISVILGEAWRMLPQEERDKYIQGARDLSEEQKLLYPDCWKRKRSHSTS